MKLSYLELLDDEIGPRGAMALVRYFADIIILRRLWASNLSYNVHKLREWLYQTEKI